MSRRRTGHRLGGRAHAALGVALLCLLALPPAVHAQGLVEAVDAARRMETVAARLGIARTHYGSQQLLQILEAAEPDDVSQVVAVILSRQHPQLVAADPELAALVEGIGSLSVHRAESFLAAGLTTTPTATDRMATCPGLIAPSLSTVTSGIDEAQTLVGAPAFAAPPGLQSVVDHFARGTWQPGLGHAHPVTDQLLALIVGARLHHALGNSEAAADAAERARVAARLYGVDIEAALDLPATVVEPPVDLGGTGAAELPADRRGAPTPSMQCVQLAGGPLALVSEAGFHCRVSRGQAAGAPTAFVLKVQPGQDFQGLLIQQREYEQLKLGLGDIVPDATFTLAPDGKAIWVFAQEVQPRFDLTDEALRDQVLTALRENPKARAELQRFIDTVDRWRTQDDAQILDLYGDKNLFLTEDGSVRYVDSFNALIYESTLWITGPDPELEHIIATSLKRLEYLRTLVREAATPGETAPSGTSAAGAGPG